MTNDRFPSPFELPTPPGCEGWEEMYPYHALFSEDRREFEEGRCWFLDRLHCPEPLYPFDAVWIDCAFVALSQASARLFAVPPSLGVEYRLLNGYPYWSENTVTDEATIDRRAELFRSRGGYYYQHWGELYARWQEKVGEATRELEALEVPVLPALEEESIVTEGRGVGSSHALLVAFNRVIEGLDRILQYHFEFLNLGYAAYVALYELCRESFPDMSDQTIATMVSGVELLVLRPDDELRRLARRAIELGVADSVKAAGSEAELRAVLAGSDSGAAWLADFEETKSAWFYFSYGNGLYNHHRSWIDDTTLPISTIGSYIGRLDAGEDISRPYEALIAERDRIVGEYRALLPEVTRGVFDERLALARMVFRYVEDHNFYIEHRYLTIFWNKVREFGALLARQKFLAQPDDVFYLRHDEVRAAIDELRVSWSAGGVGAVRGPRRWPPIVARRKSILEALRRSAPPPALGRPPEAVTDPVTVMLMGITTERVREWLGPPVASDSGTLVGVAGSPGVAAGPARLIFHPDQLAEVEEGEILVAPSTSPSWTPVFGKVRAAVLDSGGIMCHAAIVAREYALPAVVGTATGTKTIKTGDRVCVDGDAGVVTRLD
jgi:pyruvate, water dikinase